MPMKSKTMEFETTIVTYHYSTETLTIEAKEDNSPARARDWPKGKIELPCQSVRELIEGLAGIGREIPGTAPTHRRLPHG